MTSRFATLIVVGFALMPLGCRDDAARKPTFAVTGKVTLDGKPAASASVVFHPVGAVGPADVKPHGTVNTDGTYTLSTYGGSDGAPAGDYLVTVQLWLAGQRSDEAPSNRLDSKYATHETTPLKATVAAGPTAVEPFALKR